MKFLWTTLYVKNMEESIAFYSELLGLQVTRRFPAGPGMEITFLGYGTQGETLVELITDTHKGPVTFSEFISIGFAVDSVEGMLERVKGKNIAPLSGVVETPTSRFFTIQDPNGLTVQLFQQK